MKEENIGVLSAGERFGFKGFEWIVLDNNVDGGVLAIMASAWNNEEYSFDDDGCKAVMCGFTPEEVKKVNDLIIQEELSGWDIPSLKEYLWMAVLDITEPDDIDATLGSEPEEEEPEIEAPNSEKAKTEKKSQKKQKAPATPAERKEAKETLTDTEGQADDLQIAALKNACKELMEKDPDQEDFVQQIAMKTNGFTQVTRSQCEQLIKNLGEMIAAYNHIVLQFPELPPLVFHL